MDDSLVQQDYLRQRMSPRPGDQFYLHLADLRQALDQHRSEAPLSILDYGSGGSPYRSLFPHAVQYVRADLAGTPGIDHEFDSGSRLPALGSGSFDLVLSTQVLEHVTDPAAYLAEALRLLRPGGKLLLSTHGTFPDHGCPHDFWRWTRDGLALELRRAGFQVDEVQRLTTGARAVIFFADQMLHAKPPAAPWWLNLASRVLFRTYRIVSAVLVQWGNTLTRASAVTTRAADWHIDFCVGLLAAARKPESAS